MALTDGRSAPSRSLHGGPPAPSSFGRDITLDLPADTAPLGAAWLAIAPKGAAPSWVMVDAHHDLVLGAQRGGGGDRRVITIDDAAVSERHCLVRHTGVAIDVVDLGARNGVLVGGLRVASARVPPGGVFEIGRTRVTVHTGRSAALEGAPLPGLAGSSPPMLALAGAVRRAAATRFPVLIRGESGTGKELVARALHDLGPCSKGPFVALNAATIAREIAESELFGYKRGAFTGAVKDRLGAFREASSGTLFLDEVGALGRDVQAKLLRAVEEGVVRPVGADASIAVNVRFVAATCEDVEGMVDDDRFRSDLYERLAVTVIHVPPLRHRTSDIHAIAERLLERAGFSNVALTGGALGALRARPWPGNVRQLRNVLVQAALDAGARPGASGDVIVLESSHVASVIEQREAQKRRPRVADAVQLYMESGRNVSEAARRAAIPRSTLRDLLKSAGV